jgi:hypothetical protein
MRLVTFEMAASDEHVGVNPDHVTKVLPNVGGTPDTSIIFLTGGDRIGVVGSLSEVTRLLGSTPYA